MKRVPIRSTLAVGVMLSMLVVSITVSTQAQSAPQPKVSGRWLTYVDPRFDFSFRYPSDWKVIPRDDSDPNLVRGTLVFAPILTSGAHTEAGDPHDAGPHVVIVPYLAELKNGQSIREWTELYESIVHPTDQANSWRQSRTELRLNRAPAVREEGISPLTTYQFTNVAHKNIVWSVWTNIPSNDSLAPVYDRMIRSFRFGRKAPINLNEAYGSNFTPIDLEQAAEINVRLQQAAPLGSGNDEQPAFGPGTMSLNTTWQAPVKKSSNGGNQFTATCGSRAHDDVGTYASLAVGIITPINKPVFNAKYGNVTFAGWDPWGYGNLIRIQAQGGKEAYYAHLNAIYSSIRVGLLLSTGNGIGLTGNSGTSTPHLHFHVQWGTSPEALTGMYGFTPTNYPLESYESRFGGTAVNCAKVGF